MMVKHFHSLLTLLFISVAACEADVFLCNGFASGAYITLVGGQAGNALDRIGYFDCSDKTSNSPQAGGYGGNVYETNDPGGYVGFRSGYWTAAPDGASGFALKRSNNGDWLGTLGSENADVTEYLCTGASGGQLMGGISASSYTASGGQTVVALYVRPVCIPAKYMCPGASVIANVIMNSGGGVDKIVTLICKDGSSTYTTDVLVGGDSGGAGIAAGGPFTGFRSGVFNSADTNMLSGLAFKRLDGSYTDTFGSDIVGGVVTDHLCPIGQVLNGLTVAQTYYLNWHLVGAGLLRQCGCQPLSTIPNCTQQNLYPDCKCTVCAGGLVATTDAVTGATTCTTPPPTAAPTRAPTKAQAPTVAPTNTKKPTAAPTAAQTPVPTSQPTNAPTNIVLPAPAPPTAAPTKTRKPTAAPTAAPSSVPTSVPTVAPTKTKKPTAVPTSQPTVAPTKTKKPTAAPTAAPTSVTTP